MPVSTQNISQLMLTKPLPCQRGHKIYLTLCWQNISHAREDTKCSLICVDQGPKMAAWTHKIHLNMRWQNPSHDSEDTKCISTCVDQTPPLPVKTHIVSHHLLTKPLPFQRWQNESQHVLTKPISCQREQKMISTSFDQTHHTPTSTIMHITKPGKT